MRFISMNRIAAGIVCQQYARNLRALSAMYKPLLLAANSYRTFSMKRMSLRRNTSLAMMSIAIRTPLTAQSASSINHINSLFFCFSISCETRHLYVMFHKKYALFTLQKPCYNLYDRIYRKDGFYGRKRKSTGHSSVYPSVF